MGGRSPVQPGRVRFGGMQTPTGYLFELTGGHLCLDLANTLDKRPTDHPHELLNGYEDLLDWGLQAGALAPAEAHLLRVYAARHPAASARALRGVTELREAIFQIFSAVADRRPVTMAALRTLNAAIPGALSNRYLDRQGGRFVWRWRLAQPPDLDRVLWPVVLSAGELLTGADLDRVRRCGGAGCAWLFIDRSKNRTRRWCDMSVCGNRAKATRHQVRIKSRAAF